MTALKIGTPSHIRLATPKDIEAIFAIRTSVKENHLSREQLTEMGITSEIIRDTILTAPCLWIAEVDGTPVGFSMADLEEGSVFAMFLFPEFEGLGLGRRLMEKVEETLFKHHPKIWLETSSDSRAYNFYQKLGWHVVEQLKDGDVKFEKTQP